MTQAQQPEALRIADNLNENADLDAAEGGNPAVCKLERDAAVLLQTQHYRILELEGSVTHLDNVYSAAMRKVVELEQGKCLLQIAEPAAPQAVQPVAPQLKANCYSDDNGDYWRDCPDDCDFVEGLKVGDTYELQASIRAWSETFRVTKAPDETSDDYEVELVSSDAPAHPAEGVPTSSDLRERLARLEAGCNAHTTPTVYEAIADSKAALDELDEARQRVGISLAATQPAAQAVPVLYVSKGQLDNHRDPDGVDTDGAGRYLPARKTPKGNFTAPLYERPAPAAQGLEAKDAARYRFIKKHSLILSGGTREFGWPISPFGVECDRYIDKELAAQAKQGGAT